MLLGEFMKSINSLTENQQKKVPELRPGDTVRVHTKIIEGSKERIQIFEGVIIRVKGGGNAQTFTVRKLSYGIGVERTFLTQSPKIAKLEIKKRAKVRRAYLTYLRELRGKAAKLKDQKFDILAANIKEEELRPEDLVPETVEEDAELTELKPESTGEKQEISTEDLAKEEDRVVAKEDSINKNESETDDQTIEVEEISEGLEKAQEDLSHGKDGEGAEAEKNVEASKPEKEEEKN